MQDPKTFADAPREGYEPLEEGRRLPGDASGVKGVQADKRDEAAYLERTQVDPPRPDDGSGRGPTKEGVEGVLEDKSSSGRGASQPGAPTASLNREPTLTDELLHSAGFTPLQRVAGGGLTRAMLDDADVRKFWDTGDVFGALHGSFIEFGNDIYKFVDWAAFDKLPDWEAEDVSMFGVNLAERSSVAGDLTQNILPWIFTFTKVSKFLAGGGKVGKVSIAKPLSKETQSAYAKAGSLKGAAGTRIAREAIAGGITTFALYEEADGSLTDMLNDVPGLRHVVPDFLESEPDDSEAELRLKAAFEDMALGGIVDSLLVILKARRSFKKIQRDNPNLPPEKLDELAEAAVNSDELARAMESDGLVPPSQLDEADAAARSADEGPLARSADDIDVDDAALEAEQFIPENAEDLLDMAQRREAADFPEIDNPRARNADGTYVHSTADLYHRLTLRQGVNTENLLMSATSPQEMMRMIRAIDLKNLERIKGRVETTEEHVRAAIKRLKELYEVDDYGLIRAIAPDLANAKNLDADMMREIGERAMAHEMTIAPLFDQFRRMMNKFNKSGVLDDKIEALKALHAMENATNFVRYTASEAGRILRHRRTPIAGMNASEIKKILANQGMDAKQIDRQLEKVRELLDLNSHLSPAQQKAAVAKYMRGSKLEFGDVITEYWINSILSGPKSHAANIIGNSMTLFLRPVELAGASALSLNNRGMRAAFNEVRFIMGDTVEAIKAAFVSGASSLTALLDDPISFFLSSAPGARGSLPNPYLTRMGASKWDQGGLAAGRNRSIGKHSLSADMVEKHPALAGAFELLGRAINTPGSALEAMDNLFKHLNFRSRLKMRLIDQGIYDKGLSSREASEYAAREIDRIFDNGALVASQTFFSVGLKQGMKLYGDDSAKALLHAKQYARSQYKENREFIQEALDYAAEGTFTTRHSAERGTVSMVATGMQKFGADFWPARFYIPFIGTPTNLLLFAWDRMNPAEAARLVGSAVMFKKGTPALNKSRSRLVRELNSGDPILQREAAGRVLLGNTLIMSAWAAAANGRLTGRGPGDYQQRKTREDLGFGKYSFVSEDGKEFYSFLRLDPYASILGTVADIYTAYAQTPPDAPEIEQLENAMQGVMIAAQENFTGKSFTKGLKSLLEMLQPGEGAANPVMRSFRQILGGFVPSAATSILGAPEVPVTGDLYMREAFGVIDYVVGKIPYFSKTLPPRRNILGEPMMKAETMSEEGAASFAERNLLPVKFVRVKDDGISAELASLNTGLYPPSFIHGKVDFREFTNDEENREFLRKFAAAPKKDWRLRWNPGVKKGPSDGQQAHDRMEELVGIVTLGGKTLKQQLRSMFASNVYKAFPRTTEPGLDNIRAKEVKAVLSDYRQAALMQTEKEYAALRAAVSTKRQNDQDQVKAILNQLR